MTVPFSDYVAFVGMTLFVIPDDFFVIPTKEGSACEGKLLFF